MNLTIRWRPGPRDGVKSLNHIICGWGGPVPRVGEYVVVFDGFCAEQVLAVYHDLESGKTTIEIGPDNTGEYREHVERRQQGGTDAR